MFIQVIKLIKYNFNALKVSYERKFNIQILSIFHKLKINALKSGNIIYLKKLKVNLSKRTLYIHICTQ